MLSCSLRQILTLPATLLSRAPQLHAHCTWHPSPWQRHLLIQQHALTCTLEGLLPEERQDPTTVWRQDGVTLYVPRRHAHLGTRSWSQHWSSLIWSNLSGLTVAVNAICPSSLRNCFSGTTLLCWKDARQFSFDRAPFYWETRCEVDRVQLQTAKRDSLPSWPEAPIGWGAWRGEPGTDILAHRMRCGETACDSRFKLEGLAALSRRSPVGPQSPPARREHPGSAQQWTECPWTWEDTGQTESHSQVWKISWASKPVWGALVRPPKNGTTGLGEPPM